MAKQQEDFSDIPESGPAGAVPNIPMPPQQIIDQDAPPQGQEPQAMGRPRRTAKRVQTPTPAQPLPRSGVRPIKEIIELFYAEISNHPDCVMLSSSFGGRPVREVFNDTAPMNRHMVELRFAWRDAQPEAARQMAQAATGAYEPGGRYYHLIHGVEEAEVKPNLGTPAWDNMVKKRDTASV